MAAHQMEVKYNTPRAQLNRLTKELEEQNKKTAEVLKGIDFRSLLNPSA
jgi:hypothetical protein